ncbi:amidase family protein [Stylonychia lemnae]|uniref:Amidase family protein n=1 Tax=Stylonychia lemnae TaxID=5949 RepID=A0A078B077_STYLE|nr:amidase family protein [Stylonychia lemnae]|eukprot:CDW87889.1 amidase family protein [Stylonychia lemnae]
MLERQLHQLHLNKDLLQENFDRALNGKIRVGYCFSLPTIEASLSMQRGIKLAKQALEQKGFELVPFVFTVEELMEAKELYLGLIAHAFVLKNYKRMIENYERPLANTTKSYNFFNLNPIIKFVLMKILEFKGEKRFVEQVRHFKPLNDDQLDQLMIRQRDFYEKMHKKWNSLGIEALIMPTHAIPAFKHVNNGEVGGFNDYLTAFTITHYPIGVVPVTEVQEGEDLTYDDGVNDMITMNIKKDMKGTVGLPVTIQVVGQLWEDETVLGVMKAIDKTIKFRKRPQNF